MKRPFRYLYFILLPLFCACGSGTDIHFLTVKNELNIKRRENLAIPKKEFGDILCKHFSRFVIKDTRSGDLLPVQFVDEDVDGTLDYLVFQPVLLAGETAVFEVYIPEEGIASPQPANRTYSRFVPERIDDYTWENDRVAFRTYGPVAQKMTEDNVPGGIISSGIDCWLKSVEYPIIDKWYVKELEQGGSYHEDTGEGLDNFHVGSSRGCGGSGVWDPENEVLYTSKNFTDWRTVTEGPLRTRFELDYAPWDYPCGTVAETKVISLDLGSNLVRIEIRFDPENTPEKISAGLSLHEKDGSILVDQGAGWFSYWQPHGDSELGMGIVASPEFISGYSEHFTEEMDQSHLLVHFKPINNTLVYYTGFGWEKSRQYQNQKDWIAYLEGFTRSLGSELKYELNK